MKLVEGKTLIKTHPSNVNNYDYDIVIPFRRMTLGYPIYEITPKTSNIFVGCIRSYPSKEKKRESSIWEKVVSSGI